MRYIINNNTYDLEDFFKHLIAFRDNSLPVAQAHINRLKSFLYLLDQYPLTNITEDIIKSHYDNDGISTTNYGKHLTTINLYYEYLCLIGKIDINPIHSIKRPKYHPKQHHFYTISDIESLLSMPDIQSKLGLRDQIILHMLYDTGIRVGELCKLNISDIELEQAVIKVSSKKRQRLVPLHLTLTKALQVYLPYRRNLNDIAKLDTLFLSKTGRPLDTSSVYKLVKKYAKKSGLDKNFTTHSLRHTFATHMIEAGADLKVMQLLLGHKEITTTQIYVQVRKQHLKRLHQKYHPRSNY